MADTTLHAQISIHAHDQVQPDGTVSHVTVTTDTAANTSTTHVITTYPDHSVLDTKDTTDHATGITTSDGVYRDPSGNVIREGSVTHDAHGGVLGRTGDTSDFEDYEGSSNPSTTQSPQTSESPTSQTNPDPTSGDPQSTNSEEQPSNSEEQPKKTDPEKSGKCENCGKSEPSILHDLEVFAWGFVKGAVAGAVITAGLVGLAAVAPAFAAGVGVGLAIVGAFSFGYEIGRLLTGQGTRDEHLDFFGGFFGGLVGAGAVLGSIRPGRIPIEEPLPKPNPPEPVSPAAEIPRPGPEVPPEPPPEPPAGPGRRPVVGRQEIVADLQQTVEPFVQSIEAVAPDAQVGYRGSLARGTKGPHKGNAPFDPNNFDVDAFIVSDELAARFPEGVRFRSGTQIPEIAEIQSQLDAALRDLPSFNGLRDEPFTFRIFTRAEIEALIQKGDTQFIFR